MEAETEGEEDWDEDLEDVACEGVLLPDLSLFDCREGDPVWKIERKRIHIRIIKIILKIEPAK